ncbi:retrovirus-related pol polyprotein from transposon TNT 1-94 [Tanacetum coccineum]
MDIQRTISQGSLGRGDQRTMTVAGARENVGSPVVQQNGIQCFNYKGFGYYAKECRKPKRVKDYTGHDEVIDETEWTAHFSYIGKDSVRFPEESCSTGQSHWNSTSSTDSQIHNNIMAAGSKDRPPMLGPGRYSQWRSRFLRYIDTKNNGEGLRKCILNGPYVPTSVLIQAVPEAEGRPAVQQHTAIETVLNMTPENKEHFLSEKEAIFLLLTGIGDEIYSTVDACKTANEMWIAIERLQQGESLNVQDVKTNLFWEFGKFTSRDGESMESYYSRPNASTRHKGKEIAKLVTPQSESASEEDSDTKQAQRDKDMQKNLALLANLESKANRRCGARETVGSPVVQQNRIQCFNCKGFGHYAKECRKPKRVKDYTYHKEKMMMCKQAEQGVPLQAEQADWLADTDEEIDEQDIGSTLQIPWANDSGVSPEESSSTWSSIGTGTKS